MAQVVIFDVMKRLTVVCHELAMRRSHMAEGLAARHGAHRHSCKDIKFQRSRR